MADFKHDADEAEKLLDEIDTFGPSKYPGMTYEQGIAEALRWLLDDDAWLAFLGPVTLRATLVVDDEERPEVK